MHDKLVIGITGTGSLIGQAVIKSIKLASFEKQLHLIGFDYFKDTIGSYWCNENFILPDILKKQTVEADWLNKIIEVINTHKIQVLFIGVDFELPLFAKYRKEIEQKTSCIVIVSDTKLINIANDKYLTYKFLKDNGFYHPESYLPQEFQFGKLAVPFILKPRVGARSRDVYVIRSEEEYLEKVALVDEPVIQEHVGNPSTEYTCGVLCLDGKLVDSIVLRRTLKEGNTNQAIFEKDAPPIIYDYLNAIAKQLNINGSCNFQLRLDKDGIPKIFEINPRHSGTTYMRALLGFNEVAHIVRHYTGLATKAFELREGTVIRYFEEQFIAKA